MGEASDLHLHTLCSDGASSPPAVVASALEANLAAIAVTDHDTVAGVAAAVAAAAGSALEVVPGVELSAQDEGAQAHIVGLFIDPTNARLAAALQKHQDDRRTRIAEMVRRLADLGMPVDLEAVLAPARPASVGRVHLAEAMRRAGYVRDVGEAFDRWLGVGAAAYVPRGRLAVAAACDLIRGAGGLPVLAHPRTLTREALARQAAEGVAAVEAYSPGFTAGWSRRLRRWARELGLGVSGGSDCHGRRGEGAPIGSVRVPTACFEDLKRRRHSGGGERQPVRLS